MAKRGSVLYRAQFVDKQTNDIKAASVQSTLNLNKKHHFLVDEKVQDVQEAIVEKPDNDDVLYQFKKYELINEAQQLFQFTLRFISKQRSQSPTFGEIIDAYSTHFWWTRNQKVFDKSFGVEFLCFLSKNKYLLQGDNENIVGVGFCMFNKATLIGQSYFIQGVRNISDRVLNDIPVNISHFGVTMQCMLKCDVLRQRVTIAVNETMNLSIFTYCTKIDYDAINLKVTIKQYIFDKVPTMLSIGKCSQELPLPKVSFSFTSNTDFWIFQNYFFFSA